MFSFLVRNEHNIWIPTAHLVVERENGEITAERLKHIKKWCSGKWQPQYVMTDDSAIEQNAIRLAFPGLNRVLIPTNPYQLLKHAMYYVTQIQNRALCEQAVTTATVIDNTGNMANYVQTYWLQTASKWAMYARQHSPFLLQATTTNACEAWHRKLKSGAGLSKGQVASHGIYGMILNIMDAAKDIDNRAVVAKSRFQNWKLAVCTNQYKEIGHLPVPIQKLLARELDAVEERIAKGKEWEAYIGMFAECGMEVYETVRTVWIEEEGSGQNVERANIVIRVRESFEQVQQQLYTAYEMMDRLNIEDTVQSERMEELEWANHVQATLSTLMSIRAEDIVHRHRPWEL
ncbi:hypothetical protein L211DRAFT_870168 [Terfezia boudieri ATCC MYA-4762]|uniref:Uncharacterized protein n=1 Tax=Terfezia boudieri ATCC MYA-4762 TaxID=1051890 RepID=A0A3N4LI47_9PEZI|nr:hypothetical protein L211DRAFT_870168 [Terfezia boudieri ATCC MYA-4762]